MHYDDLEICNPLGSKRTIHKIGMTFYCTCSSKYTIHTCIRFIHAGVFYFLLGNISPKFWSRLSCIQLVAVVKNKLIKKYKMNAVLEPMVADILKLVSSSHSQSSACTSITLL